MRAEVFFVRRAGVVIAEPTGGTSRCVPCPDPQRWWADTAPGPEIVVDGRSRGVEIEVHSAYPDHGSIGRVVRVLGRVPEPIDRGPTLPTDVDAVYDALGRVPDSWLPYEVRVGERSGSRLDAFVGTLLPVPPRELCDVLGTGWVDLILVEPWLRPQERVRSPSGAPKN